MNSVKKSILISSAWSIIGHIFYILIVFSTNIVLSRLLKPYEFGLMGIIMFFIYISNVLIEGGLGGALIRETKDDENDYATVFTFNFALSIILYLLLCASSSYIASFYNNNELKNLISFAGLILIINSFQITQNAKLVKKLKFKKLSIYKICALIPASIFSIVFAYLGLGIWSLLLNQILISGFLTLIYWFTEGFYFKIHFDRISFSKLYKFGVNTTFSSILNTTFKNIYQLILGKLFAINQAGLFYQAKKLQEIPDNMINMLSQGPLYSSLTKFQEDTNEFILVYKRIMTFIEVFTGLIISVIFLYSSDIINLFYGPEWTNSAYYLRVLCISSFFYAHELINRIIFKVYNQTSQIFKLEIIKKITQGSTIIIGIILHNIDILIYGFLITSIFGYLINLYFSLKIIKLAIYSEIKNTIIICLISIACITTSIIFNKILGYNKPYFIFELPFFILLYFFCLKISNVYNIIVEINYIKKIIFSTRANN